MSETPLVPPLGGSVTDAGELLQRVSFGDPEAFATFVAHHLPNLLAAARRQCRSMGVPVDLAADFAHDTVVRAMEWLPKNGTAAIHKGWLQTVMTNLIKDWLRREEGKTVKLIESAAERGIEYEEPPLAAESQDVRMAFNSLSDSDQYIIRKLLLEGESAKTIAQELGVGDWAIYKRYQRALGRMRKHLTDGSSE